MSSWCTWQESSLHLQRCSKNLPWAISHTFYPHRDEIRSSSYLACNTWQCFRQADRLPGWYLTESNVQTKYLVLKYERNEHGSLELWKFSCSFLRCKNLSLLYLQDFWILKTLISENQCHTDGNSSAYCHKNVLSCSLFFSYAYAQMHTQAKGSVLQELRGCGTPLCRAKSGYIWTNNPV